MGSANRPVVLLNHLPVSRSEHARELVVGVVVSGVLAVLGQAISFAITAEELPILEPHQIVLLDLIVELPVLVVELRVREDARLQKVIAEVPPPNQVVVDIGQRRPERLQNHLPVLLAYDLVPGATGRVDSLFADRLHLGEDSS